PLRRTIQRHVENPMSRRILAGEFKDGTKVAVEVGDEGLTFTAGKAAKEKAAKKKPADKEKAAVR
ncbi:MAG: hypothetical protein V3S82_00550, partial [Dehalococcoidia bacterium]